MDEIDLKIINILSENSRTPGAEIARKVGRSRVAVAERIERLVATGEITRFTISRPALPCRAIFEIILSARGTCDAIMAQLNVQHILVGATSVAGASDLFLTIESKSVEELHSLRVKLSKMDEVAKVTTHVVTRTFK